MRRGLFSGAVVVAALAVAGCNGDTIPIDPREEAPLGDQLPVDAELSLEGLSGPVDAVRDDFGRMHIYATNIPDAMMVQGYLIARDRHVQLEFFRRVVTGRLAEAIGTLDPGIIETDISFRHVGMHRVAEEIYAQASDETRAALDAYASGVSQLFREIRDGERALVDGIVLFEPKHFTDWSPVDSVAMARLQTFLLSYDDDTGNQEILDDLRETFTGDSEEPGVAARAGIELDYIRFEPPDETTVIDGLGEIGAPLPPDAAAPQPIPDPPKAGRTPEPGHARMRALTQTTTGFRRAIDRARSWFAKSGDFGSNNWAISGARTASGRAMLASDPHLTLSAPSIFWPVSIHVAHRGAGPHSKNVDVGGIAFAGIPGIVLGHNENVAWGATVAGYDVTDIYAEKLTADGSAVVFEGGEVPLETVDEVIIDGDGNELVYTVQIVPHHGPIIPNVVDGRVVAADPAVGAVSIKWTGMQPSFEIEAVNDLSVAGDVDEARMALEQFGVGAQNWVLADTSGDILWTTHSKVPYRDPRALAWNPDTYEGLLPCLMLPGDGTAEWTGFWADDAVPWAKNPNQGFLATANGDQVGGTLDNDPSNDVQPNGKSAFLACSFAFGFRQGRARSLIEGRDGVFTLDDMEALQADHRSPLGARIVPKLLVAIENAQLHAFGASSHPDLAAVVADPAYDTELMDALGEMLGAWQTEHDFAASAGVDLDDNQPLPLDVPEARASQATLLFNVWLVRFMARTFGDELERVGRRSGTGHYVPAILHLLESDPQNLRTFDAASADSILWDDLATPELESRHERMIRALLDAVAWLEQNMGAPADWRWGRHHLVRFEPPIPLFDLAIPRVVDEVFVDGFPRHGDMFNVDASNFDATRAVDGDIDFGYGSGPTQRFVIEMDPNGLSVRNALPGGAVWDRDDPHYADEAELWRRNETHAVPFYLADVLDAAESRTLILPTPPP